MSISAISRVSSGSGSVYALSPFLNPPYTDPIFGGLPQLAPIATVAATATVVANASASILAATAPAPTSALASAAASAQQQLDATNNSRDFGLYGDSGLVIQSFAAIAQIAALAQFSGAADEIARVARATPAVTPVAPIDSLAVSRINVAS